MDFFVVYLECQRYISVQRNWIQNPEPGEKSKIFYSSDSNDAADFSTEPLHYLNKSVAACYNAFVYKKFDNLDDAESFVSSKRVVPPVNYKSSEKFKKVVGSDPVDFINISSSESEDEGQNVPVQFLYISSSESEDEGQNVSFEFSYNSSSESEDEGQNDDENHIENATIQTDTSINSINVSYFSIFRSIYLMKIPLKLYRSISIRSELNCEHRFGRRQSYFKRSRQFDRFTW